MEQGPENEDAGQLRDYQLLKNDHVAWGYFTVLSVIHYHQYRR
jgi:hypothetical protein